LPSELTVPAGQTHNSFAIVGVLFAANSGVCLGLFVSPLHSLECSKTLILCYHPKIWKRSQKIKISVK